MDIVITEEVTHGQGGDVEQGGLPNTGLGVLGSVHVGHQLHGAEGPERVILSLYWRKQLYRFSVAFVLGKPQSTHIVGFHGLMVEQVESLLGQVESSEYHALG